MDEQVAASLVQVIALPPRSEIEYMNSTAGDDRIVTLDIPSNLSQKKAQLLKYVSGSDGSMGTLLQEIIADGSFIEFFAEERANGDKYGVLREIGDSLRQLLNSVPLRFSRVLVLRIPNYNTTPRTEIVQQAKTRIGLTDGTDWDALMYKTIPSGGEMACVVLPDMFQSVTESELGLMMEMQRVMQKTITETLEIKRVELEVKDGYIIKDYDAMIEAAAAGQLNQARKQSIQSRGDAELMNHIMTMTPAFIMGILPGSIQPAKIMASHDSVGLNQLQGSIRLIAEQQVYQISIAATVPEARAGMMDAVTKGSNSFGSKWTTVQAASIQTKASLTSQLEKGMMAMKQDPSKPSKDYNNYAAGGPNTLSDQLLMETQQSSVRLHMTPIQKEILTHSMSVLLACIRVRFDATKLSKIELVAQEDIDYLQVIERLAQYCEPNSHKFFSEIAVTLQQGMGEGHNKVRLANFGTDVDTMESALANAIVKAEEVARAIPLLNGDLQQGKTLFTQVTNAILLSLAAQNREEIEIRERAQRRLAVGNVMEGTSKIVNHDQTDTLNYIQ